MILPFKSIILKAHLSLQHPQALLVVLNFTLILCNLLNVVSSLTTSFCHLISSFIWVESFLDYQESLMTKKEPRLARADCQRMGRIVGRFG
jgi:hypothetical protein